MAHKKDDRLKCITYKTKNVSSISKMCQRFADDTLILFAKLNVKILDYIAWADPGFLERGGHIYILACEDAEVHVCAICIK